MFKKKPVDPEIELTNCPATRKIIGRKAMTKSEPYSREINNLPNNTKMISNGVVVQKISLDDFWAI
jgi:hypothetical protein